MSGGKIYRTGDIVKIGKYKLKFVGVDEKGNYVLDLDGLMIKSDEFPPREHLLDEGMRKAEIASEFIRQSLINELRKLIQH